MIKRTNVLTHSLLSLVLVLGFLVSLGCVAAEQEEVVFADSKALSPSELEPAAGVPAYKLGMVTGSPTGTYYRFGHDIKDMVEKSDVHIAVKESNGSIDNVNRISSRENAAFGIVQSDVLGFLTRSKESESKKIAENLRMIFPFYQEEVHVIASKRIKSFNDLTGKSVIVGPKGSGSWLTSMNLFNIAEVRPTKILRVTPEEGLVAVLRGKADAMIFVAGKPVKLFENLDGLSEHENYSDMLKNVHFLPLDDPRILREYAPSIITENDYSFVDGEVPTAAVTAILVSFDFSDGATEHAQARCEDLQKFGQAMADHIDELKEKGHPKWKEVDLDAEVGIWKRDKCASNESAAVSLENELLHSIESKW